MNWSIDTLVIKQFVMVATMMLNPGLPADQDQIITGNTFLQNAYSLSQCKKLIPEFTEYYEREHQIAIVRIRCVEVKEWI